MKLLIWILALVVAIPTNGISLLIALAITIYINQQEEVAAAQIFISTASSVKNEVVNKYYRYRIQERLTPTSRTDSDIFDSVMKICTIMERVLKENGRFHDDKDEVIQLAVRLTAYSEEHDKERFIEYMQEEFEYIAQFGISSAIRRSHKKQNHILGSDAFDDDDDDDEDDDDVELSYYDYDYDEDNNKPSSEGDVPF